MDLKKISYLVGGRGCKRKGVGLWGEISLVIDRYTANRTKYTLHGEQVIKCEK